MEEEDWKNIYEKIGIFETVWDKTVRIARIALIIRVGSLLILIFCKIAMYTENVIILGLIEFTSLIVSHIKVC